MIEKEDKLNAVKEYSEQMETFAEVSEI